MFVNFQYNKNRDIENYKIIARTFSTSAPSKALELYKQEFGNSIDENNLLTFINQDIKENNLNFPTIIKSFEDKWRPIER